MRVLQVVMALDYGGVESYAIRVSRAMVDMGDEVTILSSGGPLEKLLEGSGINYIREPLKGRDLGEIASQIRGKFDIINGHNYNGGRVGSILSKMTGIPAVMTVHGPRRFLKRVLFNGWTPRVIALSGSDGREISGFMGISKKRVSYSSYPIDVERFHPRQVDKNPDEKLIVHISRFSNRKAKPALNLIGSMPSIIAAEPRARLLIAGTGPMLEQIKSAAAKMNERLGEVIRIEPPRLDISELLNMGSVFVGTATTAMEAMACGAPLIAAGRTGYFGLVSPEKFEAAHDVLFADHGSCVLQPECVLLTKSVLDVLHNEDKWKKKAAIIAEKMHRDFSPKSAAESLQAIYKQAIEETR